MMLNLDTFKDILFSTFNELLFSTFKEQTPEKKKELLAIELASANDIMSETMCCLYDELTKIGYESELPTKIENIKSNCENLLEQIKVIDEQIAEEGRK